MQDLIKKILQFKPTLKRLCAALVICAPMVALTNNLQKPQKSKAKIEQTKEEKRRSAIPNDRCISQAPGF